MPAVPLSSEFLQDLRHPVNHRPLAIEADGYLLEPTSGDRFPIIDGIPSFVDAVPGDNPLASAIYNSFAFAYEPVLALGDRLGLSHEIQIRRQVLARLQLPSGAHLLEFGCGAGGNRPYLPPRIDYTGLDRSMPMLRQAQHQLNQVGLSGCLVHADAQRPPFREGAFDMVLCMGLVQHLASPAAFISGLPALLRPHGRLLLIDESVRLARRMQPSDPANLGQRVTEALGLQPASVRQFHEYVVMDFHF